MSKLKFHLHKFDKNISFQLVDFSDELVDKGFLDTDNMVCVVYNHGWSSKFEILNKLRASSWSTESPTLYLNLVDRKGDIIFIKFKTNEDRDLWYDRFINAINKSFSNNTWISSCHI